MFKDHVYLYNLFEQALITTNLEVKSTIGMYFHAIAKTVQASRLLASKYLMIKLRKYFKIPNLFIQYLPTNILHNDFWKSIPPKTGNVWLA